MDLIDSIRDLASRIDKQLGYIQTEEATKTAFVMPFISALGYNVFDPREVSPELIADIGTKKGEKVDYAILMNEKPIILFECKWCGSDLNKEHASQLYRYFSATEARFGVLTNGIVYRFYSDLEKSNVMDEKPFLEFNMLDIKEPLVEELKKFTKSSFDLNNILATASELKYTTEIRKIIEEQSIEPSEDFVRFFASKVYSGKLTQQVRDQFAEITAKAFKQFINDKINERLKTALSAEVSHTVENQQNSTIPSESIEVLEEPKEKRIQTTQEELESYYIIKTMLRKAIDPSRITLRDALSYCSVILDDNNRKPLCRLYFNNNKKYIGIFDADKKEEKIPIETVDDIYKHYDKLKTIAQVYDAEKSQDIVGKSISAFSFKGKEYKVTYWKDLLLQLCSIMANTHKDRFEDILKLSGRQKPFFTKDPSELRSPKLIDGTDIYAELNLGAEGIVRLSKNVINIFGYNDNDLSIKIE